MQKGGICEKGRNRDVFAYKRCPTSKKPMRGAPAPVTRAVCKSISVRADYSLNIELNLSYKQFEELMKPRQDGAQISA